MSSSNQQLLDDFVALLGKLREIASPPPPSITLYGNCSPSHEFMNHLSSMENLDYHILMDLYCNCKEFRETILETSDLSMHSVEEKVRLENVNFPLKDIVRLVPGLKNVSLSVYQFRCIKDDESYPDIISLTVVDDPLDKWLPMIKAPLMRFPNLETFSSLDAKNFVFYRPLNNESVPSSIKELSLGLVNPTEDVSLTKHPLLKKFAVTPNDAECDFYVEIPNHLDSLEVDVNKFSGDVYITVKECDAVEIFGRHRGQRVETSYI